MFQIRRCSDAVFDQLPIFLLALDALLFIATNYVAYQAAYTCNVVCLQCRAQAIALEDHVEISAKFNLDRHIQLK